MLIFAKITRPNPLTMVGTGPTTTTANDKSKHTIRCSIKWGRVQCETVHP